MPNLLVTQKIEELLERIDTQHKLSTLVDSLDESRFMLKVLSKLGRDLTQACNERLASSRMRPVQAVQDVAPETKETRPDPFDADRLVSAVSKVLFLMRARSAPEPVLKYVEDMWQESIADLSAKNKKLLSDFRSKQQRGKN